jgi:hypothetical protein
MLQITSQRGIIFFFFSCSLIGAVWSSCMFVTVGLNLLISSSEGTDLKKNTS